jgi:hypothetical protein
LGFIFEKQFVPNIPSNFGENENHPLTKEPTNL